MKCLLIFALVALVSAHPPLGDECTVNADCGRQAANKICVFGKCVLMEAKKRIFYGIVGVQSGIERSTPPPFQFGRPSESSHRDFEPNGMKCGDTFCTTGFGCINGRCKFNGNKFDFVRDFLMTPCPVPCEQFGQICVRGVCK